ncbi:hypothetical protein GCT19_32545 [Paraburkholderia sp. CNPSo 3155]|uniref:hypothetical protein n=1 Tax=Paraburkholderia atlantica TaxID=2654982 RepID=UPI00128B2261|nr:hypothetical protein [Paraburkholderia atlantica]MBB5419633.1 hypothetical protein [Paraburkholderia atlantica]MPW10303.1 hypothetical protein [Paraburkholderia atlantica]
MKNVGHDVQLLLMEVRTEARAGSGVARAMQVLNTHCRWRYAFIDTPALPVSNGAGAQVFSSSESCGSSLHRRHGPHRYSTIGTYLYAYTTFVVKRC